VRAKRERERERDEGQQAVTRCTSPWQRAIMDDYECSWMIMDDDGCEMGKPSHTKEGVGRL